MYYSPINKILPFMLSLTPPYKTHSPYCNFLVERNTFTFYNKSAGTFYYVVYKIVVSCVCVCVFFPFIMDIKFVGRTSRGHTGGRSHRIFNPPSFCGACLNFSREKDSAIPFPRRL